jgi:hypothetical protein
MSINIHKLRIFDIAAGLKVSLDTPTKLVTLHNIELIKKAKNEFRDFLDSATPSVYVLDLFGDIITPLYDAFPIMGDPEEFAKEMEDTLHAASFPMSAVLFQNRIDGIVESTEAEVIFLLQQGGEYSTYKQNQFRNVFRKMGSSIGAIFKDAESNKETILISDPEYLGLPDKLVFIAKSFNAVTKTVHVAINTVLRKFTENDKASYGDIASAGHTAVSYGDNTYGINTPLIQEILIRAEAGSSKGNKLLDSKSVQDSFVKSVPIFIDNAITFSQDFTPTAKNLMSIGFTFAVPMDKVLNSVSGTTYEAAFAKSLVKDIIMPGIVEALRSKASWLKENVLGIHGSPTIPEYAIDTIVSKIKGIKPKTFKFSETRKSQTKLIAEIPSLNFGVKLNKNITSGSLKRKPTPKPSNSSASLDTILRNRLSEQIKANMGTGNAKNILNYRTGRFADTATIERTTQSRAGMVSVFYNYMRNPYGTFSEGGAQQWPKTRDPKLLISKSIREIGAQIVGNRMRAILV